MSTNKKQRISRAQINVLIGVAAAMLLVILLSLVLHNPEHSECCPWCFGACPWCFLVIDLIIIGIFAAVLLAMTVAKVIEAVADAMDMGLPDDEPVQKKQDSRHKPQRDISIPKQKKHREHHHGHTLRHARQYDATVSLQQLMDAFEEGATVNIEILKAMGLVPLKADGYKVLVGDQEKMDRSLNIHATSFSAQAKQQIVHAGGSAVKVYH